MVLLAAFIAIPLIEIALFIQIGGWIGLWPTLLIVVITAIVGTVMVRSQGFSVLRRIQRSIETLEEDPTAPLAHGAMILFSGALLLTPGFFTDAVGFALLAPPVREHVFQILRRRVVTRHVHVHGSGSSRSRSTRDDVIDADFEEVDPDRVPPRPGEGPSPWTRR